MDGNDETAVKPNELDPEGHGLLILGKKRLVERTVHVKMKGELTGQDIPITNYPLDSQSLYVYKSHAGGLVPPEFAAMGLLTQQDYGQGWFEGMRFYESPFGLVMITPWKNYARSMHSNTSLHPNITQMLVTTLREKYPDFHSIEREELTPEGLYRLAGARFKNGQEISYPVEIMLKNGQRVIEDMRMMLNVSVGEGKNEEIGMFDYDAILKILAFTNRLVSTDYFPPTIEMQEGGYGRPSGKGDGQKGQKIQSIVMKVIESGGKKHTVVTNKPIEFSVAMLAWKLYLNEQHYARGLDILESPFRRAGRDLAEDAKMFFNYGNPLQSINLATMLGYGEVASLNQKGRFVEGSAENVFVIMKEGGRHFAYTPPTEDGCLPGTTRDGLIQTLEDMDIKVKFRSLTIRELKHAKGIFLSGTGAQMIHVRSITRMDAAYKIADMARLDSEGMGRPSRLYWDDFNPTTIMINNGQKDEIIDRIQKRHKQRLLDNPDLLEPVHALPIAQIVKNFGVPASDFSTKEDREDESAGRFNERTRDQEELKYRYRAKSRQIRTAMEKSKKAGVREAAIFRENSCPKPKPNGKKEIIMNGC